MKNPRTTITGFALLAVLLSAGAAQGMSKAHEGDESVTDGQSCVKAIAAAKGATEATRVGDRVVQSVWRLKKAASPARRVVRSASLGHDLDRPQAKLLRGPHTVTFGTC